MSLFCSCTKKATIVLKFVVTAIMLNPKYSSICTLSKIKVIFNYLSSAVIQLVNKGLTHHISLSKMGLTNEEKIVIAMQVITQISSLNMIQLATESHDALGLEICVSSSVGLGYVSRRTHQKRGWIANGLIEEIATFSIFFEPE